MSLTVQECHRHIEHSLGGTLSPEIEVLSLINRAGEFLVSVYPWKWLEGRSATLDLVQDQTYVALPSDFRELTAWEATSGLTNDLEMVTTQTITDLRTNEVSTSASVNYAAITHMPKPAANLMSMTESVATTSWTLGSGMAVALNDTTGPTGDTNADKLTGTGAEYVQQVIPGSSLKVDAIYTASIYVKNGDSTHAQLVIYDTGATASNKTKHRHKRRKRLLQNYRYDKAQS